MPDEINPQPNTEQPQIYQIRIKGHLDQEWTDWFDGLTICQEDSGDTLISGPVADQPALHGLIRKVRDLGLPLVSVNLVEHSPPTQTRKDSPAGSTSDL